MLAREKARTASLPKRSAKSMGSRTIPQINATKGSKTRTMGQERAQPVPGPVEAWLLCHVRKLTHPPRLNSELPPLECVAQRQRGTVWLCLTAGQMNICVRRASRCGRKSRHSERHRDCGMPRARRSNISHGKDSQVVCQINGWDAHQRESDVPDWSSETTNLIPGKAECVFWNQL